MKLGDSVFHQTPNILCLRLQNFRAEAVVWCKAKRFEVWVNVWGDAQRWHPHTQCITQKPVIKNPNKRLQLFPFFPPGNISLCRSPAAGGVLFTILKLGITLSRLKALVNFYKAAVFCLFFCTCKFSYCLHCFVKARVFSARPKCHMLWNHQDLQNTTLHNTTVLHYLNFARSFGSRETS